MQIRRKITLWISCTALCAGIAFSSFVFLELLDESVRLIDRELRHMAEALFEQGQDDLAVPWTLDVTRLPFSPDRYWISITDRENAVLYRSALTRYVDIPILAEKRYTVERIVPSNLVRIGQDEEDEVYFRVRIYEREIGGRPVIIRIAKPIEEIEEEVYEVLWELGFSLGLCTLAVIFFSHRLAGRILAPLTSMNQLACEIREKSLDRRIPVGKSRDELATLATSLNEMFDRLQYSFARQKEFVGNASHELKSPINLLLLAQEELLQRLDLPDGMRDDLERQLQTMRRMSRLIRNLLDLSRLEQQEAVNVSAVDLGDLLRQVLDEYREMLANARIEVETEWAGALRLAGDAEKLQRLLINLVDNAIRYNDPADGRIRITARREDGNLVLWMANRGLPIPSAEVERVFEQFYRVEKSRATVHGGAGLGLTIARRIVELHGGAIRIDSTAGWTEVTVILPRRDLPPAP